MCKLSLEISLIRESACIRRIGNASQCRTRNRSTDLYFFVGFGELGSIDLILGYTVLNRDPPLGTRCGTRLDNTTRA